MPDQKLNININLNEIRYSRVSDIIDYKLEFMTQEFKNDGSNMADRNDKVT